MYGGGSGSPVEDILKAYAPGTEESPGYFPYGGAPDENQPQPQGSFADASDYFSE
jgi:hypothetical protein